MQIVLSSLPKTWIFDLDGTLVIHNGYKLYGEDCLLDGVKEFFSKIPETDYVLILTARTDEYKEKTLSFLKKNNIRYNNIIFNLPMGERILVNDDKPSGLQMSHAINKKRDKALDLQCIIDYEI